ncbi:TetR/AcrR family transcriptional regulator [SAR92 clade bacterium H455]|uniref:TetR/AcrR family transcriptional regulator n=1 Tax=SAR92 clade bacterium H455 TaxID=2974818 RepID=A0ABY5TPZ5_9GAMM|nr:TetR/AcrR family transcriptional regulator [SAR92 clade bacterium H455]
MLSTKSLKNLPLRERKKRMTYSRIVDCAGELFIANGYQTTTVDAIAEGAEISKPTFFNYFSTKHAVLQSMVERMDNEFIASIAEELEKPLSTEQRLCNLMTNTADYMESHIPLMRVIIVEGLGGLAKPDEASNRLSKLNNAMAELLSKGRDQGDIDREVPIDLQVQIVVGSYLYSLMNALTHSPNDLGSQLTAMVKQVALMLRARK